MRYLPVLLLACAGACFAFAYWGLETPAGRRAYDEMAGIIPAAVGMAGALFVLAAAAIGGWRWFKTRRKK